MSEVPLFRQPFGTDWQLSKLRHESEDIIIEIQWIKNDRNNPKKLNLFVETNKAVIEKSCANVKELKEELDKLFGKTRCQHILQNWHELSYRKT